MLGYSERSQEWMYVAYIHCKQMNIGLEFIFLLDWGGIVFGGRNTVREANSWWKDWWQIQFHVFRTFSGNEGETAGLDFLEGREARYVIVDMLHVISSSHYFLVRNFMKENCIFSRPTSITTLRSVGFMCSLGWRLFGLLMKTSK